MHATGPREERETVIIWNEKDATASIWTASESVYRSMRKRGWSPSVDEERHAVFIVPKGQMKLPRQKRRTGFARTKEHT